MDIQILTRLSTTKIVHDKGVRLFNTFMIEIFVLSCYWLIFVSSNLFIWCKIYNIYNGFYLIKIVQNVHLIQNLIFSSTFWRKKVELLSSLLRLGRLSFLSVHFSKTIKGVHLKLGILVHYQKRNPLRQGGWPCDLFIQIYLPLIRHP